jgi:hypothetical protein
VSAGRLVSRTHDLTGSERQRAVLHDSRIAAVDLRVHGDLEGSRCGPINRLRLEQVSATLAISDQFYDPLA